MGPFELMDLVGVDVGLRDRQELLRAELRRAALAALADHRPLRRRRACTGARAGAATTTIARGGGAYRAADPEPPRAAAGGGEGVVVIAGRGRARATSCATAAAQAGYEVRSTARARPAGVLPALIVDCSLERTGASGHAQLRRSARLPGRRAAPGRRPSAAVRARLARRARPGRQRRRLPRAAAAAAGAGLVELTRSESSSPLAAARAERFFGALGKHVEWVGDAPGLVLGRIVCQVINEAAFALGEGVGERRGHRHAGWCSG